MFSGQKVNITKTKSFKARANNIIKYSNITERRSTSTQSHSLMTTVEATGPSVPEVKKEEVVEQQKTKQEEIELPHLSTKIRKDELDPMELLTQRAIALQLKSLGIEFTNTALEDLFDLVSLYLNGLLEELQKITQTQRRFKTSPKDLKLLLRDFNISPSELEDELTRSKKDDSDTIQRKKQLEKLAQETIQNNNTIEEIDPQEPSFVFFSVDQDLHKLIPPQHKRSKVIPNWLPEFPPDHTFRKTPKYLNSIKDQKLVRQKIVEESKFGEQALENLLRYGKLIEEEEEKEDEQLMQENDVLNELEEQIEEDGAEKKDEVNGNKVDIWSNAEKKFDIQSYATARLQFYKKKEENKKKKLEKVDHEYFAIISKLSTYGPDQIDETVSPDLYLDKEFKKTMHSLKQLKKKKAKRQVERKRLQEEEDKKRDELKAQKPVDFNDFDNFENFENFDTFGSGNGDFDSNDHDIHFEGVDDPAVEKNHQDLDQAKDSSEDVEMGNTEPTGSNQLAESNEEEKQTPSPEKPEASSELPTSDVLASVSEPPTTAPDEPVATESSIPPSSAPEQNNDDEEDEDEDEDMFDEVPI